MRLALCAFGALSLGACFVTSEPADLPRLTVAIAPLDLPGVTDACYDLAAWNRATPDDPNAALVWSQTAICASQYGAEGGVRFTGICDAEAPGEGHRNAVRVVLASLRAGQGELVDGRDYVNPCPAPMPTSNDNGCVLVADCTANQDTRITFDLAVMRQSAVGFFDTVVRFDDVFCAAKLDCVDEDDAPLTYLHAPPHPAGRPDRGPRLHLRERRPRAARQHVPRRRRRDLHEARCHRLSARRARRPERRPGTCDPAPGRCHHPTHPLRCIDRSR